MKRPWMDLPTSASGFATLSLVLFLGNTDSCAAQANSVPLMTIEIYNDSTDTNIYPVLSSGTSEPDKWLQAAFQVPKSQLANNPYPKTAQYRLYINPTADGIPPGGHVTLTLPLYTQLVATDQVNPRLPDQYIDWWGGGRIEIFDRAHGDHQPPVALTQAYTGEDRPDQSQVSPIEGAVLPTCPACQPLEIFRDPAGLKNNEPSQLTEYTLGAVNLNSDPYQLDVHNVDYDVSYVDTAYLPAAMEPYNNTQVGYVGTPQTIDSFRNALNKFVGPTSPYEGWPQFIDNQKKKILKLPSALHILAGDPDMTPGPWPPITKLQTDWEQCTTGGGTTEICLLMQDVNKLFQANYDNYVATYSTNPAFLCNQTKTPVAKTDERVLAHVYGWGPFTEQCDNAAGNLLENTPGYYTINPDGTKDYAGYQHVKAKFDQLQYWPTGEFDPYVVLIHGEDYINAPNVYAYSVDDAVGNMQVEGDGLIIAVGGPNGLPNPEKATPPINVSFGFSPTDRVQFTMYGICTNIPDHMVNPNFASFAISATTPENCPLSFRDNNGQLYKFTILKQPPYPATNRLTPETHAPIDCSGNDSTSKDWCENVFAYTVMGTGGSKTNTNYAIAPAPPQCSQSQPQAARLRHGGLGQFSLRSSPADVVCCGLPGTACVPWRLARCR